MLISVIIIPNPGTKSFRSSSRLPLLINGVPRQYNVLDLRSLQGISNLRKEINMSRAPEFEQGEIQLSRLSVFNPPYILQ
jgi:hypothetical protein